MDEKVPGIQPHAADTVFCSNGLDHHLGHEIRHYLAYVRYGNSGSAGRSADTGNGFVRVDLQNVCGE